MDFEKCSKKDLIRDLADRTDITLKDAEVYFNAVVAVISDTLKSGKTVSLADVGVLNVIEKKAEEFDMSHLHDGKKVIVKRPARKSVRFKLSGKLRDFFLAEAEKGA